jgi:site-specific recombinase XerC
MASLYKRSGSPYWWLKKRDALSGEIIRESTGLRIGVGPETRKARDLEAQASLAEAQSSGLQRQQRWSEWVPDFLNTRYAKKPLTLERYSTIWKNVSLFLEDIQLTIPIQLTRDHCFHYMEWRRTPDKKRGKYSACHNTALLELKVLRTILNEAVARKYIPFNPCTNLKIARENPRLKPEFTDEQLAEIERLINNEQEPLRTCLLHSFLISRWQGCRLSETYFNPQTHVDVARRQITFHAKGNKTHTTLLHENLLPLFARLIAENRTETYPAIGGRQWLSRQWFRFFKRSGIKGTTPNACFHSLRVTGITRAARAGVSESKAMRYFNHASTTVHRAYQRLQTADLSDVADALSAGSAPKESA